MRVFDSPPFIDVKTCCSCLETQTEFLCTEFNLSARPSFLHNFRLAPLNGKLCHLQHDFFMQYLQSGALNICLPLALATLKMRLGTKTCECRIFSTAILFIQALNGAQQCQTARYFQKKEKFDVKSSTRMCLRLQR